MRRLAALILAAVLTTASAPAIAQDAGLPQAERAASVFAPLEPFIGRTWRGRSLGDNPVQDVQRWDWAVGGHAVRVVHSVNDGAYAGETLIFHDRTRDVLIFHYFTTGGFHTTGMLTPVGAGAFDAEEAVHGAGSVEAVRSTVRLDADGVLRARSRMLRGGEWSDTGGFDYEEDAAATVVMPGAANDTAD